MKRYNPSEIEPKWQKVWADEHRYDVTNDAEKKKFYISCMFPYPSGAGMHTGHAFEHAIVDSTARFYRQHGYNVLNPMGWDAFGLPAENYAIKTGTAPAVVTKTNIANFKNQLVRMGTSIDWSREINTSDPEYYRWTQWIFAEFFKRGLAYQKESMQWWCPKDKTVLANEQVVNGHCWRCDSLVEKKSMKQWFLKITDFADALLEELPALDWPKKIKTAQENWIGRSEGAEVSFALEHSDDDITVFSTRPDTLFGATFLVLAPEHPLSLQLADDNTRETVKSYIDTSLKKSEIERMAEGKEKTGVFTGSYATNPANGEKVPIWVADYVLWGYGTGAVMGVPAHDERDYEFATKFELPIVHVIDPVAVRDDAKDKETDVNKDKIVAVVLNERSELLTINWGELGGRLFIGGTVEGDESPETTALREVTEETGYTDLKVIEVGQETFHYKYYAFSKRETHETNVKFVYLSLQSDAQQDQNLDDSEKGNFTVEWVSKSTAEQEITEPLHKYGFDKFVHEKCFHGEGTLVNSDRFDGMSSSEAREEIVAWLEQQGRGKVKVTYKMRDWLLSRQRYWGAPIPIVHCETHGAVAVPEDQLPVVLPEVEDYAPKGDGKSVLARETEWVKTTCPECGGPAERETDTMDGYACSSWYLMRFTDPHASDAPFSRENADFWAPLDMYVGGDHAVAHLLYVRFWSHVFEQMGLTGFKEPVKKLVYHGLVAAEDGRKMSKSLGNVVDPLDIIDQGYGADALRVFLLFLGPINENSNWSSRGIAGVYRFLNRAWTLTEEYIESPRDGDAVNEAQVRALTHKTIKKVTSDYRELSFNTAIAAMMEYTNELYKLKLTGMSGAAWDEAIDALVRLIAPMAPHMGAELWSQLGNESTLEDAGWPSWDEKYLVTDTMTIIVQVNGKLRAKLVVPRETPEDEIKNAALADVNVQKFLASNQPAKVIYITGKLLSIVVK